MGDARGPSGRYPAAPPPAPDQSLRYAFRPQLVGGGVKRASGVGGARTPL